MAAAYGFNQDTDLAVTLPSASSQCSNFCASAKNNSSPNTFSIDSKALISSGGICSGAGGSPAPGQTFESYKNTVAEDVCNDRGGNPSELHTFGMVRADGYLSPTAFSDDRGGSGHIYNLGCNRIIERYESIKGDVEEARLVYIGKWRGEVSDGINNDRGLGYKYNFEKGIWSSDDGRSFRNGERVE